MSFSIHHPQNLGSPTPAVTFNWCEFKTQIAWMVVCRPRPALHMVEPGGIRNLWSLYWCKWYNGIMLMTRHWITLVYLFNWLSDKPSYGPIWDPRLIGWYRCCLMWFLRGLCTAEFTVLSLCLLGVRPAGRLPSTCPKTQLGEGNWFFPLACGVSLNDCGYVSARRWTATHIFCGFLPCQGK